MLVFEGENVPEIFLVTGSLTAAGGTWGYVHSVLFFLKLHQAFIAVVEGSLCLFSCLLKTHIHALWGKNPLEGGEREGAEISIWEPMLNCSYTTFSGDSSILGLCEAFHAWA